MSNTTSVAFGSGILVATPATALATPVQFGALQDVSIDFSFASKQLMGQYQFPIAFARGEGKISGKAKFANINSDVFNTLFFNSTTTVGQKLWAYNEGGTITTTAYTAVNGATYDADLSVFYVSTGVKLTKVASAPAAGQYTVTAAGVYGFNTTDNGKAILVSYSYTQAVTGAKTTIGNNLAGVVTGFQIDFYQTNPNIAGAQWSLRLYNCFSSKLSFASKNQDFNIPEFDFEAVANAANNIGEINTAV